MPTIQSRRIEPSTVQALTAQGVPEILARVYAGRGVRKVAELDYGLKGLLSPERLKNIDTAAEMLADAIEAQASILIVADYDCDGATACAVGVRGLRAMGARVSYLVPDRFTLGYGLTPGVVELAAAQAPDILMTVDNGIASLEGVAAAQAHGMTTIITDHHLPGEHLPDAEVIVNPNQPGCSFPSKALAGVGVMFYVLLALRAVLRARGAFAHQLEPHLGALLDLVALGTVADVVPLDHNNRLLVAQGLQRMRSGKLSVGLQALFTVAGRQASSATTFDLGFALGPRINAAGRLSDMSLGIELLVTDDMSRALEIAQALDSLNRERRGIEAQMQEDALISLAGFDPGETASIVLFEEDWHQGVVGIVAGRIKERFHRPTIAFARGDDGLMKGSGRSIPGVHLRDALDWVSKQAPSLIHRFGGHAMAAGLTLQEADLPTFIPLFEAAVRLFAGPDTFSPRIDTDGALSASQMNLVTARLLAEGIWGQGFPAPVFDDHFKVENQRLLKDKHLKLNLLKDGVRFEAIYFHHVDPAPEHVHLAYKLGVNSYNGVDNVQLLVEAMGIASNAGG